MLHLITGSNGAGKTLFTLKWVRERSKKENRKVYYNGRFKLKPEIEQEFGWEKFEFKDWQDYPDGAIFLVDECHNDLPNRPTGSKVPDHVRMLAEHRSRGFDFYMITQHPSNMDVFVRKLIGAPGWHRHLKRIAGAAPAVNMIQWDATYTNCEAKGSSKTAHTTRKLSYPKDVYKWYDSTTLNTAQYSIPKIWIYAAAAFLGAAYLIWNAQDSVTSYFGRSAEAQATKTDLPSVSPLTLQKPVLQEPDPVQDYVQSHVPRVPDFPHTAPRYDSITQPVRAPRIAACISMQDKCKCYTQQGTLLQTDESVCRQIVKYGHFEDWEITAGEASASSLAVPQPVSDL